MAGIVDKNIHPTQFTLDALQGRFESVAVSDVHVHGQRATAEGLQFIKDAPASANPIAMPRPIPPFPPVTIATRPVRSNNARAFTCAP